MNVNVSPERAKSVKAFGDARGLKFEEATDRMLEIADGRVAALQKYARGTKAKAPKAKAKKVKKAKAPKADA